MSPEISRREFVSGLAAFLGLAYLAPQEVLADPGEGETKQKTYTFDDYVEAVIQIESKGDPNAKRWEAHLRQYSYGLGQLLGTTAREIEKNHPELPKLGKSQKDLERNLLDPEINRLYTETHYRDQFEAYKDPFLAVAAYNAGHFSPRNARCMQQLGDVYKQKVSPNGNFAKNKMARTLLRKFQKQNRLRADGVMGTKTYNALQRVWARAFPKTSNPYAIVPQNGVTPHHVEKFRAALESLA